MSPADFRNARKRLGRTQSELAEDLQMGANGDRTIRRWEAGKSEIPGPAQVAIELLERVRALEIELGINPERNAALAKAAGKSVEVRYFIAPATRDFEPPA